MHSPGCQKSLESGFVGPQVFEDAFHEAVVDVFGVYLVGVVDDLDTAGPELGFVERALYAVTGEAVGVVDPQGGYAGFFVQGVADGLEEFGPF